MSVLKGEGKVPILFGSTSIAVGTQTHQGYLARPDLTGEWPTIVVVASEWGVTSSIKDVCRRLARHGFALVAPDLYRGAAPARTTSPDDAAVAARAIPAGRAGADLEAIEEYITNPAGFWSNAEQGFGVLGIGEGARFAVPFTIRSGAPIALVSPRLAAPPPQIDRDGNEVPVPKYPLDVSNDVVVSVLGLSGRDDATLPVDDVSQWRRSAPQSEWVLYDGVGARFFDDAADDYDAEAFDDALDRLIDFFEKHLP